MRGAAWVRATALVVGLAACGDTGAPAETGRIALDVVFAEPSTASPARPAQELAALRTHRDHLESVRIYLIGTQGGESREVTRSPAPASGFTDTIHDLRVGTYTAAVEGLVDQTVDFFGVKTGIVVTAGSTTSATVVFDSFRPVMTPFTTPTTDMAFFATYSVVPNAESYLAEVDIDPQFTNPARGVVQDVRAIITVGIEGRFHARARAINRFVADRGRFSDAVSVDVVQDITASGDVAERAPLLGFGTGVNGRVEQVNILPDLDEDWFAVGGCTGDSLTVETTADRLVPRSPLDSRLQVYDDAGTTLGAENDNLDGSTFDSRLGFRLPTAGTYTIRVTGSPGSVGHYLLDIDMQVGPNNDGTTCTLPVAPGPTSWGRHGDAPTGPGYGGTTLDGLSYLTQLPPSDAPTIQQPTESQR